MLLLMGVSCGDAQDESSESSDGAADVASPAESDVADADASSAGPSLTLDPSKAKAFVSYQDKMRPFLEKLKADGTELQTRSDKGDYEGVVGGVRAMNDWSSKIGTHVQEIDKLRDELGLTEEEVTALSEIELGIFARASGTALQEQAAELEKSLASLPAEQRSEIEQGLEELRALVNMTEVRAKYGDAIVDAMLALEPELRRHYDVLGSLQ
jgi:hypothetical protein